jgi:resuscitation-promoting factor RpfA
MSNRDRADLRDGQGDAAVERAWRMVSTEQPSARLDAAILAAAREAVGDRNETSAATPVRVRPRQRWNQWAPMAAAAAVAGLALTLVQILPHEPGLTPAPAVLEPAAPAAQESATPAATEVAPRLAPARASSAERQEQAAARANERNQASASQSAPPPALSAESSKAADAAPTEGVVHVDEWVQRIMALHEAGDVAAAADALRALRAAEPGADRHLPESLREWARSVQ